VRNRTYRWVWAGLGNPGPAYRFTRHNFGFLLLEALAEREALSFEEGPFQCQIATWQGVLLVKPLTYMNLSGQCLGPLLRELSHPLDRFLVIHDDLDLPLGRFKFALKGGAGGHRGVLSIIEALGTKEFPRLKLGIGRPPAGISVRDYVLSPFGDEEWPLVKEVLDKALEALVFLLENDLLKTMSLYHRLRKEA